MRNYKSFDFFAQLALGFAILAGFLFDPGGGLASVSLIGLALLQIISLFIHAGLGPRHWKSALRRYHLLGTGIVIGIMIYGLLKPAEDKYDYSGLGIIAYALVPAGIMAFFYTVITGIEWYRIRRQTVRNEGI